MSDDEIQEARSNTECIPDRNKPTFEYRTVSIDER